MLCGKCGPTRGRATMAGRFKQILRAASALAFASAVVLVACAGTAVAGDTTASLGGNPDVSERPVFVTVGDVARAPIGWVDFCLENKSECATNPSAPRDVVLTSKAWTDMLKVNAWVNESIKPMTDLEHWGVVERWNYPDDGYGDCEDYVLEKRRMLMQAGWPREGLLTTGG